MIREEIVTRDCPLVFRTMDVIDTCGSMNPVDWKFGLVEKTIADIAKICPEGNRFYIKYDDETMIPQICINLDLWCPDVKTVEDYHKIEYKHYCEYTQGEVIQ